MGHGQEVKMDAGEEVDYAMGVAVLGVVGQVGHGEVGQEVGRIRTGGKGEARCQGRSVSAGALPASLCGHSVA